VVLHGGPGAGCLERHARFFDPKHYRIMFFDQRGCGKSSPRGSLEKNTTWDLVADIEKFRLQLGVTKSSLLFFFPLSAQHSLEDLCLEKSSESIEQPE